MRSISMDLSVSHLIIELTDCMVQHPISIWKGATSRSKKIRPLLYLYGQTRSGVHHLSPGPQHPTGEAAQHFETFYAK